MRALKNGLPFLIVFVSTSLAAQTVIFSDNFESGRLNPAFWSTSTTTYGRVEVAIEAQEVPAAHGGIYGVIMGGTRDGESTVNRLDLHLDLSGHNQVDLSFWIRDNDDETDPREGIWFSDDGGANFIKVYNFDFGDWPDIYGQLPPLDVDALARERGISLTSRFVIRFEHHCSGDFVNQSCCDEKDGFFLDDVAVLVPEIQYTNVPFSDNFESGRLESWWKWSHPVAAPAEIRPSGLVEVVSDEQLVLEGFYSAALGKRTDGEFATNALDLHLNLAGMSQVELSLLVSGISEETHAQDGIWFSDNGGTSFRKVLSFDSSGWDTPSGAYPPLDVDRLAKEHGLTFTEKFVIRFQQRGNGDFMNQNCCDEQDGIVLDQVQVKAPALVYARPPLYDGFENGELGPHWRWRPAWETGEPGTVRPSGIVRVAKEIQAVPVNRYGLFGLALGKEISGLPTTNAVDFHLDLWSFDQVILGFWLKYLDEKPHSGDGLWFSNDGGKSFREILRFDQMGLTPDRFEEILVDVVDYAARANLTLSREFVVRFQQHGREGFSLDDGRDGFFIDDLSVSAHLTNGSKILQGAVPWLVSNGSFSSRIAIFNEGQVSAEVDLVGIDRDGNRRIETLTIQGESLFASESADLFPGLTGYALYLHSNRDSLHASFLIFNQEAISGGSSPSQATGPPVDLFSSRLLFGYVPGDQIPAIVLVAPEVERGQVPVRLSLYGVGSKVLATTEIQLQEKRPFAMLVTDLFGLSAIPVHATVKAFATNGSRLAGTTFVFNNQRQPSMAAAIPLGL